MLCTISNSGSMKTWLFREPVFPLIPHNWFIVNIIDCRLSTRSNDEVNKALKKKKVPLLCNKSQRLLKNPISEGFCRRAFATRLVLFLLAFAYLDKTENLLKDTKQSLKRNGISLVGMNYCLGVWPGECAKRGCTNEGMSDFGRCLSVRSLPASFGGVS